MEKLAFYKAVSDVQQELKAPKNQFNKFGKYSYRNCEDILEGFKKLPTGLVLTVSDEIVMVGDRFYVKAIATLTDGENSISNTGFARESLTKKGMDDSQVTGSTSSYARKYALNGLFCIDDTKDADSMDNSRNNEVLDPEDQAWVDAIKSGFEKLENIQDPHKRKFIESKL